MFGLALYLAAMLAIQGRDVLRALLRPRAPRRLPVPFLSRSSTSGRLP